MVPRSKESRLYDFPVQFPFGRNHTILNGICLVLFMIALGLILGYLVVAIWP